MRLDKVTFQNIYKKLPRGDEKYGEKLFFNRSAPRISPKMVQEIIPMVSDTYTIKGKGDKLQYIMFEKGKIGFTTGRITEVESFKKPQMAQKFNPNYN